MLEGSCRKAPPTVSPPYGSEPSRWLTPDPENRPLNLRIRPLRRSTSHPFWTLEIPQTLSQTLHGTAIYAYIGPRNHPWPDRPSYGSPRQVASGDLTGRSDLHSHGLSWPASPRASLSGHGSGDESPSSPRRDGSDWGVWIFF